MIGWTLCSGIGAPEVAAPWVDWRLAAEIEPFPRAVLQERLGYKTPEDHNQGDPLLWGDMTEVTPELARRHGVPLPDLLVAGTPCQAFSIAGLRGGTDDARGNLTLKFVETCHAIVDARPDGKLAVLWENVPGVLSDKGNAFGCFLGGLVGAVDALPRPENGSWPSEGMVEGPRARLAWCVLDAQFFGVAQRRRRVFVVVDFGGSCDPAQVLLEPESLRGDTPTREKAGQGVAGSAGARAETGSDVAAARMVAFGEYSEDGSASALKARDYKDATDLVYPATAFRTTGNDGCYSTGDQASALTTATDPNSQVVAFSIMPMNSGKDYKARAVEVSRPLMAGGPVGGNQGGDFAVTASVFDPNQITSKTNRSTPTPDLCHTIPNTPKPPHLFCPTVRRLVPVECARLQGFPDNWSAVTYRGKPASDGPQYKAYGNSMAVPVIRWILDRIKKSMAT